MMEAQIATTTALLKASAFLVFILVRAAMDIFSHGVHIYIPVYHWDENYLWLPSRKVVVFSQKEASMLICGENVHSCCVQRRAQTHVKRFHTFACDAVGLQCWVNVCLARTRGERQLSFWEASFLAVFVLSRCLHGMSCLGG